MLNAYYEGSLAKMKTAMAAFNKKHGTKLRVPTEKEMEELEAFDAPLSGVKTAKDLERVWHEELVSGDGYKGYWSKNEAVSEAKYTTKDKAFAKGTGMDAGARKSFKEQIAHWMDVRRSAEPGSKERKEAEAHINRLMGRNESVDEAVNTKEYSAYCTGLAVGDRFQMAGKTDELRGNKIYTVKSVNHYGPAMAVTTTGGEYVYLVHSAYLMKVLPRVNESVSEGKVDYSETYFKMDKFMGDDEDDMRDFQELLDSSKPRAEKVKGVEDMLSNVDDRMARYMPKGGTLKGFAEYIVDQG